MASPFQFIEEPLVLPNPPPAPQVTIIIIGDAGAPPMRKTGMVEPAGSAMAREAKQGA